MKIKKKGKIYFLKSTKNKRKKKPAAQWISPHSNRSDSLISIAALFQQQSEIKKNYL
jgi:hypothetical protein